jgi:glycosyltransferase involved in cell wall biosynthesis
VNAALIICANAPYPPTSGTPLRTWQTISLVARTHCVGVLSIGAREAGSTDIPGVAQWRHIDVNAPERTASGFPLLTAAGPIALLEAALREMVSSLRPRVIIFSNIWMETRALPQAHAPRIILDLHNAYSAYALATGADAGAAAAFESSAARCVDAIWTCSEEDARALRPHCAPTEVVVVPNGIDVPWYAEIRKPSRGSRRGALTLLFVASYWYEPNRIAAEMLITGILPAVRAAFPRVRLLLVGAAPSDAMLGAAKIDRQISLTGRVHDVRPYLELADIVAAPLTAGSGTRLKLLEALAARRAVVTTTKGAEGLALRDGSELLIRDDVPAFAQALIDLGEDAERRVALAEQGYRRTCELYGWDALAPAFAEALG